MAGVEVEKSRARPKDTSWPPFPHNCKGKGWPPPIPPIVSLGSTALHAPPSCIPCPFLGPFPRAMWMSRELFLDRRVVRVPTQDAKTAGWVDGWRRGGCVYTQSGPSNPDMGQTPPSAHSSPFHQPSNTPPIIQIRRLPPPLSPHPFLRQYPLEIGCPRPF